MRKWHRWLVVFSAIFMIWIAGTGFVGQVMTLGPALSGKGDHDGPPPDFAKSANAATPGAKAPDGGPQATGGDHHSGPGGDDHGPKGHHGPPHDLYHFIIDLHSGNFFGPIGKVISTLMGAFLLFFSVSGVWMYVDMFRRRRRAGKDGLLWD